MDSSRPGGGEKSTIDDDDAFVYVYDRREKDAAEIRVDTGGLFTFDDLKDRIEEIFKIKRDDKFVIVTTNREEVHDDTTWDIIDKGDTLYILSSTDQELCAPAVERVNYLPHYDTIVKGGMYEYYASEGQNPLPYAFAELIDNALAATVNNVGPRNIEIRLHFDDSTPTIFVIDNGKGMTPRQLNNWAIYRLSKFVRKDKRSKVNLDETVEEEESFIDMDAPKSLNSDISYFGVGGKQAIFFIGTSTTMISRPRDSQDVHELTISKEEFMRKEKNHEAIYSGVIRNRKEGDASHLSAEEDLLAEVIQEEGGRGSFTVVMIQGISPEHVLYLKGRMNEWTRQLAHIYHYYLHGPNGNIAPDDETRVPTPFKNIDIQVKLCSMGKSDPKIVNLREFDDDMQSLFARAATSSFEFKALVDGTTVDGVLRYHPFLYDSETYPSDVNDPRAEAVVEDEHDYAIPVAQARGRRPIFECFWNGRLIPYTLIDSFDWCEAPKKIKSLPTECYNRVSGVLWTNDNFQVSTNKLTFIDLELKLKEKFTSFCRIVNGQEKRTSIEKEFTGWLKECHEQYDKQIHFAQFQSQVVRSDLPKNKQTPWALYKQVDWDGKTFKSGQLVRILRTVPMLYGSISRIMLYGDHAGDVYATGGDLEIIQEPKSIYNETKIVPLSKLDRMASKSLLQKYIDEEEGKLPSDLIVSWPEGNMVHNNEKRTAGKTIGDIKVEIVNKKGEKISQIPGKVSSSKKLLMELKVILHSSHGDETIVSHISQHGKSWPYWFRKMDNVKHLGTYTLQLQVVLNESGENVFSGKELPSKKIKFTVIESEPERFTVGMLSGPFHVGVAFSLPLDLQDEYGNPTKPNNKLKPVLESSGMEVEYCGMQFKGTTLMLRDVIAKAIVTSSSGKNFSLTVRVPGMREESQSIKLRLLPGPPRTLLVSPEEELVVENGKAPVYKIQVQDVMGNNTTTEGRHSVLCKLSGAAGLPSYASECSSSGSVTITGTPILVKKMKDELKLTAKFDIQGYKDVKTVERGIQLVPSGNIAELKVAYHPKDGKSTVLTNGQEITRTAGEQVEGLTFTLLDEAEREIVIDDKLASKIKLNWTPKFSQVVLLRGSLPNVKAPTQVSETKYCQVSIMDGSGIEFGFVVKALPGDASQMKCRCVGPNTIQIGQPLVSEIFVFIKDKFGNDLIHSSEKVCKDLKLSGEGLKEDRIKISLDAKNMIIVKGILFDGGSIGRKELAFTWHQLKDYVRLEMMAGPAARLKILNFEPNQVVTVYNENKFPSSLTLQLTDDGGNPTKTSDVKVQLAKDPKLKLIPTPQPERTNKEGQAEFGNFTVCATRGTYEIQPKAFISTSFIISGPKLKISVQSDPTRPSEMKVDFNTKHAFIAGETMPEFSVKVYAEDDKLLGTAKQSHLTMKLWKSEGEHHNSLPSRTLSYGPESPKKWTPGLYSFKERKIPELAGSHNIMFVYFDGKHQLFSTVVHIKIEPAAPKELVPSEHPGTPTVSNTRNYATRCVIRNLKLELRDKYENAVTKGMNGSVDVEIQSKSGETELPQFVGGGTTNRCTLAGGTCVMQNITLQENSPGTDGAEYELYCTVNCSNLPRSLKIPPYIIPFLFFDDAKKQSQMATLSKERDNLQGAIRTYKSLFETTEQLIEELKISVKEAQTEETRIREQLKRQKLPQSQLYSLESVEKLIQQQSAQKDNVLKVRRRMCGLQQAPTDPEVLGKIGHLAQVADDECARVLSWHMSSDMDCAVTLTTRKAKDIYNQTHGKQQVLPLDSIYKKSITEWRKPLPHMKYRPSWSPPGYPIYARELLNFTSGEDKCKLVFAMLLGDTLILNTLDDANAYRQELVKFTHCPTILTRGGDRIRSNGKFGGLMNKALPIEKLRGAVFGAPLSAEYHSALSNIETLQNLKSAILAHGTAKEELSDQSESINTPEMKAKYAECREVEKQLQELEKKLGVASSRKPVNVLDPRIRTMDRDQLGDEPATKKARGAVTENATMNGTSTFNSPTRQSKRIASMTPGSEGEGKKRLRKT